jgi:hypothetical protein
MVNSKILFRNSLADEKEIQSAQKHFDVSFLRNEIKQDDFIIPRYSCLPFAKEFFEEVSYAGAKSINSYNQFQYISDLKNWVQDLGSLTPMTWFARDGIDSLPENKSFIVKGQTNSKKFFWNEMMFAKDKSQISSIIGRLNADSLINEQELYIREYIQLKQFKTGVKGLPITNEYRFFVAYGEILSGGFYWSDHFEDLVNDGINLSIDNVPKEFLSKAIEKISSKANAFVIDVAETANNDWIVIELNAFEQSGLSCNDADDLYLALKNKINA